MPRRAKKTRVTSAVESHDRVLVLEAWAAELDM
jgi:hypothetical protein